MSKRKNSADSSQFYKKKIVDVVKGGFEGAVMGAAYGPEVAAASAVINAGVAAFGDVPDKKMNNGLSKTPTNQLAGRAAARMKGSKNVKLKARKVVKVSKSLREKVKKVIAGETGYGAYYIRDGGMIGMIDTKAATTNQLLIENIGKDSTFIIQLDNGPTIPQGSKVWYAGFCYNINNTKGYSQGCSFVYFTPMKFLNAASTLFANKAVDRNWQNTAGNLSMAFDTGAGSEPATGTFSNPITGALKMHIHNSYVTWKIKNVTQRSVTMKIYCCVPKVKYAFVGPLTALQTGSLFTTAPLSSEMTSGTNPDAAVPIDKNIICHPMFEPNQNEQFNNLYKYEVTEIVLKPGEEFHHMIQGPKNYELDYKKLAIANSTNETNVASFFKDTSKLCMISVQIDSVLWTGGTVTRTGLCFNRSATGTDNAIINAISIEVEETYKISCPEVVGFVKDSSATGTMQLLNKKGDRKLYSNFNDSTTAAMTYQGRDEDI